MYDEPKLLDALEEKLGFNLAVMNEVNFEVPDIIERGLPRGDGDKFGNALTLLLQTHTDGKRRLAGEKSLQDAKGSLELYGRQKNDIFGIQVARQLEVIVDFFKLYLTSGINTCCTIVVKNGGFFARVLCHELNKFWCPGFLINVMRKYIRAPHSTLIIRDH